MCGTIRQLADAQEAYDNQCPEEETERAEECVHCSMVVDVGEWEDLYNPTRTCCPYCMEEREENNDRDSY